MSLTPKQQRFCEEYLTDCNATAAYRRAGYAASSDRIAASNAATLLVNQKVAAEIARLQAERSARTQITADRVLQELAVVGFSDPTRYTADAETGKLELEDGASPESWRAVSSVKRKFRNTPGGSEVEVEFRLWNKVEALKQLGQHLGLFDKEKEEEGEEEIIRVIRVKPSEPKRLG